jgi:curved DNA-binding protein CbpA
MVYISDPYKVLNLPHSADATQIKKSYRQLARKYHPDTWSLPCFSEDEKQQATIKFTDISNAYGLLEDEKDKAEYDRMYKLGAYDKEPESQETKQQQPTSAPYTSSPPPRTPFRTTAAPPSSGPYPASPSASAPFRTTAAPPSSRPYPASPSARAPFRTTAAPYPGSPSARTPFRTTAAPAPPARSEAWTTAVDPSTGRIYYYNSSTGERSWQKSLPPPGNESLPHTLSDADYRNMQEHPAHAKNRPDNHQCYAFCALLLCPPIGVLAMYHSIFADRCWSQGLYGESVSHARQAPKYACLGTVVGMVLWIHFLFFREPRVFEWPDFDWGEP